MAKTILTPDSELNFPDFTLLRASAGSGKTRALAHRYIQFILSGTIHRNKLPNILAVTFSNNAAREMKDRILGWLKAVHLGNKEHTDIISTLTGREPEEIRRLAGDLVDHILDNYSDFQVRTIDSFMASVFKSSALEFGVSPTTEIIIEKDHLIDYTFSAYLRNVRSGSDEAAVFEKVIGEILLRQDTNKRFPWDPTGLIAETFKQLYIRIASLSGDINPVDLDDEMDETFRRIKEKILQIDDFITSEGFEYNGTARFDNAVAAARENVTGYAIGRHHSTKLSLIRKGNIKKGTPREEQFNKANDRVNVLRDQLNELYALYNEYHAQSYYNPHLRYLSSFNGILGREKREQNIVFIDDIGKMLGEFLTMEVVPYIYLMLGDSINHYLIDEFQDTSPLQWSNLEPLIENSLSQGGSFFAVGDTKQAIYSFRGADYRIMRRMDETPPFPSVNINFKSLDTNYRSFGSILRFNESFFNNILRHIEYGAAARLSGLDHHVQKQREEYGEKGYARSIVLSKDKDSGNLYPEKKQIIDIIHDAVDRGYSHGDIAVLAFRNTDVTNVSSWLSDAGIKFISHSNLDVRSRKLIGEVISLLKFLNSPLDDHSFASFCMGDLLCGAPASGSLTKEAIHAFITGITGEKNGNRHPLYRHFRDRYPEVWAGLFEHLFTRAGHLSIYDLTNEIYKTFSAYDRFPEEEASFTKFLETIKDFESTGMNSLPAFLDLTDREDAEGRWNIDTPEKIDAVRLMTVHKAKGLGFKVVIIVMHSEHRMKDNLCVAEIGGGLQLLYINANMSSASENLEKIYNLRKLESMADYLNGIYVACTRAEEEMYVIAVPPGNEKSDSIFRLLPDSPFGEKRPKEGDDARPGSDEPEAILYHHNLSARFDFGDRMPLYVTELIRGDLIHRILSQIMYTEVSADGGLLTFTEGGESTAIEMILDNIRMNYTYAHADAFNDIPDLIRKFLRMKEISPYYIKSKNRTVLNETEITDVNGRLYRIDRLVRDPDILTVLDFKTGDDIHRVPEHESQVRSYLNLLREIHPDRSLKGIVAYFDTAQIREVT